MNEQFHQQIGKMLSSIEHNTKITEKIASDVAEINTHLAKLNSKVASHELWLQNLDGRAVEERKYREDIREEISYYKGATKFASALWGTVSAIVVGVVTHFATKN